MGCNTIIIYLHTFKICESVTMCIDSPVPKLSPPCAQYDYAQNFQPWQKNLRESLGLKHHVSDVKVRGPITTLYLQHDSLDVLNQALPPNSC